MIASQSASVFAPARGRRSLRGPFSSDVSLNIKLCISIAFVAIVLGLFLPNDLYQFHASAQTAALSVTAPR